MKYNHFQETKTIYSIIVLDTWYDVHLVQLGKVTQYNAGTISQIIKEQISL